MSKLSLTKPTLILLYGFPGSGKTFFSRQLCDDLQAAHVQGDRIRSELFEEPRYDRHENDIVSHLTEYMAEEFLNAGISVVYDVNAARIGQRRQLRDMARKAKAGFTLIWLQIDVDTAFVRVNKRDRRKADDKYAMPLDNATFESLASIMQNPEQTEDFMVISGKHAYQAQRNAVVKKLYEMGLLLPDSSSTKMVKPGLVNLVPATPTGRVDHTRRNIMIR